jgi:hypothetical protein
MFRDDIEVFAQPKFADVVVVGIGVAEQVTGVEVLISAGPVVRGVVLDDTDAPVPSLTVTAHGGGVGGGGRATSDARGALVFTGLAPGHYVLMAIEDEVFVPAGAADLELAEADVDHVEVRVRRGAAIVGHVEPRQPCEVRYEVDGSERRPMMPRMLEPTMTDGDGVFELGPATPGKATLFARCASGDQGALPIVVAVGMPELVVAVKPGASIAGRVVDGEGRPVAGVTVMGTLTGRAAPPKGGAEVDAQTVIVNGMVTSGAQALTSSTGGFLLNALEPGTYQLRALDRGKPLRRRGKFVEVALGAAEAKTGVEVAVDRPNGVIKGVVTGPDGKPLADAWVSVSQGLREMAAGVMERDDDAPSGERSRMIVVRSDGGESGVPPALTDASGQFMIADLPHARYEVVAEAQAGRLRGRVANITPDATVAIQAASVTTLSGTVRGARGPAALFSIELDGPTTAARTFTDGVFALGRVDPGAYTVRVTSADGNAEVQVTVQPGQPATVEVALASNAVVIGKLVDPQGAPLVGVGVVLVPDNGDGIVKMVLDGPPPTSGPDGRFRLERKAGKVYLLALTPPRPFSKGGLSLEAGKTLDLGVVEVAPRGP